MGLKSIFLDTNAYIAFKRDKSEAVEIIRNIDIIGINNIVIGELLAGFAMGNKANSNRYELKKFLNATRVKIFDIDQKTAEYYALIYQQLKQKDRPMSSNNIWVASSAVQHNLILFTYNSDFQYIDDLKIGNSSEDFI